MRRALFPVVATVILASSAPRLASAAGSGPPSQNAQWVTFTDQDANSGKVGGTITIGRASNESSITHYVIRWGLLGHCSAANSHIATIPKTGSNLTYQLPLGTTIPGAVYEILVYTKNQNGERPSCNNVWTPIHDLIAPMPTQIPAAVSATFTASDVVAINPPIPEGILLRRAASETNITNYALYWGDIAGHKLNLDLAVPIAVLPANGQSQVYEFPPGATVPPGAIYVLGCSRNFNQEYCGPPFSIGQRALYPISELDVGAILDQLGTMVANLDTLTNCPGLDLVEDCGNQVCEGAETATNCPSDCTTYGLASYNYQTLCDEVQSVFFPTTIAEVQYVVQNAAATGQRVKVSGAAHSATDIMCTDGVILGMGDMDTIHGIQTFEGVETVYVDAGVVMFDLGQWLDARNRSLGFVHLGFNGTTVGGTIGTSSHGSSSEHNTILAQRLVSLEVVGADGVLRTYTRGTTPTDTWKALATHLGLLGVVVRARIQIEPQFNLHVRVTYHDESELFDGTWGPNFIDVVRGCDYGQLNWFPGLGKFARTCGMKTTAAREPGARNMLLNPEIPDALTAPMKMLMQAGTCDLESGFTEFTELFRYLQLYFAPPLVKTVGGSPRATGDAIGPSNLMMSSPLIASQEGFFQLDWEVAVPETRMNEAMAYVRDFLDGENAANREIALPLVGVFVRFSEIEDNTLMAYENAGGAYVAGQTAVHVEMPIYVPVGLSPAAFADYMEPFEEYVATLIAAYDGRGHWGKNRDWIFPFQVTAGSYAHGNRLGRFRAIVQQMDPSGVFRNDFADALGIVYAD